MGMRTLYDSGNVAKALDDARAEMTVVHGRQGAIYSVTFPSAGPQSDSPFLLSARRKNPNYKYVWSHEFGTRKMCWKFGVREWGVFAVPRRAFIAKGLYNGFRKAWAIMNAAGYAALKQAGWNYQGYKNRAFTMQMGKEFKITQWDLLMTALPPNKMYMYMGIGADALSIAKGGFSMPNVESFLKGMAKGKAGMTKKVQRRKLRRGIWK
jgi:hypothetical protein